MLSDVYLGLGSNLGNRRGNLDRAFQLLRGLSSELTVSSLYETSPEGFTGQPAFVNAACGIWTRLSPYELLNMLKEVQVRVGARPAFVNGPRAVDIDILTYGRAVMDLSPGLTIPHLRMAEREFVLRPLADIAPGLFHPVLGDTIEALLRHLASSDEAVPHARR